MQNNQETWLQFRPDGSIEKGNENASDPISPTFLKRFQSASALTKARNYEQALAAYQQIMAPFENSQEQREVTLDFLVEVELQKAYCLTKLGRFEEAIAILESQRMREAYLDQLTVQQYYDYYFLYALALGNLRQLAEMHERAMLALNAAQHMGNLEKCEQAWELSLYFGQQSENWEYVLQQSREAHQFGMNHESIYLQWIAGEFTFYALRGLGRKDEARRGAQKILERYRSGNAPQKVQEWEALLQSVQ